MSKKLLQIKHLSIALKSSHQQLVRDISLSLEEANAAILLGQSGSGKTMTCRAILGLLNRNAFQVDGDILFDGVSLLELKKKDALSLYEQAMARAGLTDTKRILSSNPYQLSGGMLQRCLIALAIAGEAKLVIADEPTTALDAIHRDTAVEQFLQLQEQGCALLIVTHDFDVARHIGGHVIIMKEGQMVEQGSSKEVLQNPKATYTRELINAIHLGWR